MMREWKLRFMPLALVAFLAAGCGDGTDPGNGVDDLDADLIAGSVDAILPPVEASADAQYAVADFMMTVLGSADPEAPAVAFDRPVIVERIANPRLQSLVRSASVTAQAGIPAELYGRTYVWDPNAGEFGQWVVDETRTGAPASGVRVIWYLTSGSGYAMPLQERGHVDLTNASVAGLAGIRIQIVATSGTTGTLADFTQAYDPTETTAGWSERFELEGTFGSGTQQVEADISLISSGSSSTFDETYGWNLAFDGPDGSYSWALDGSWDESAGSYDDAYDIVITRGSDITRLTFDLTGADGENGTGALTHKGVPVANITVSNSNFAFSKPGGGSFTAEQIADLEMLTYTMFVYGPLLLLSLFSLFIFI